MAIKDIQHKRLTLANIRTLISSLDSKNPGLAEIINKMILRLGEINTLERQSKPVFDLLAEYGEGVNSSPDANSYYRLVEELKISFDESLEYFVNNEFNREQNTKFGYEVSNPGNFSQAYSIFNELTIEMDRFHDDILLDSNILELKQGNLLDIYKPQVLLEKFAYFSEKIGQIVQLLSAIGFIEAEENSKSAENVGFSASKRGKVYPGLIGVKQYSTQNTQFLGNLTVKDYPGSQEEINKARIEDLQIMGSNLSAALAIVFPDMSSWQVKNYVSGVANLISSAPNESYIFWQSFKRANRRLTPQNLIKSAIGKIKSEVKETVKSTSKKVVAEVDKIATKSGAKAFGKKVAKGLDAGKTFVIEKAKSAEKTFAEGKSTKAAVYRTSKKAAKSTGSWAASNTKNVAGGLHRRYKKAKSKSNSSAELIGRFAMSAIGGAIDSVAKTALTAGQYATMAKGMSSIGRGLNAATTTVGKGVALARNTLGTVSSLGTGGLSGALQGGVMSVALTGGVSAPLIAATAATSAVINNYNQLMGLTRAQFMQTPIFKLGAGVGFGKQMMRFHGANNYNLTQLTRGQGIIDKIAGGGRQYFSRLTSGLRAINTGTLFAAAGSGLVALTGGSAVAGLLGGAAIGVGAQLVGDRIFNGVVGRLAGNGVLSFMNSLPMGPLEGLINGQQWLQTQVRAHLLKNAGVFEKEMAKWEGAQGVVNLAQLGGYLFSNYLFNRALLSGGVGTLGGWLSSRTTGLAARLGWGGVGSQIRSLGLATRVGLNAGSFVGGAIGGVAGVALASALGLNPGILAAVGGAVGGAIGTVIGFKLSAAVAGATAGFGSVLAPFITTASSSIFSFIGTFIGSVGDTLFGNLFSKIFPTVVNPITIIMGFKDMMAFFATPLRNLTDYAQLIIICLSLINFFVAVDRAVSGSYLQTNTDSGTEQSAIVQTNLQINAKSLTPADSGREIVLNAAGEGYYTISGVVEFEELTDSAVALKIDDKYWYLANPGQYYFSETEQTLAGKGQGITAKIFKATADNTPLASVAGASTDEPDGSGGSGESLQSNQADQADSLGSATQSTVALEQENFCEYLPGVCR